jgi:hypothetical protein
MSTSKNILKHIKQIPTGEPFSINSLKGLTSASNLQQILCRLAKKKYIIRLSRGIYVRPLINKLVGEIPPEPQKIAKTIAKTYGEKIGVSGAEAANLLGLSTQVPVKHVFYTTGTTRTIKIGNLEITLKHISPRKLIEPETFIGIVISALWYLGKENLNQNILKKIQHKLGRKKFLKLYNYLTNMPSWMANAFYNHKKGNARVTKVS